MSVHDRRLIMFSILVGSMVAVFNPPSANAIPAFARKYETSCQTCHTGFPKLNPFGEAFRGQVPLALNVKMASVYGSSIDDTGHNITHNDFQFPQEANLFAGGTLGEHISFLGEITWGENADGSSGTELERLHLQAGSFIGPEHLFNIKLGKFAPDLTDGFHEMWISTDNGIDSIFAFNPIGPHGGTGLAEDGGGISLPSNVKGIEVYGVGAHRFFHTFGVVNGLGPSASGNVDGDRVRVVLPEAGELAALAMLFAVYR